METPDFAEAVQRIGAVFNRWCHYMPGTIKRDSLGEIVAALEEDQMEVVDQICRETPEILEKGVIVLEGGL